MNIFPTSPLRRKKRRTVQEMPMQELINRLSYPKECRMDWFNEETSTVTVHWGQYIHETRKLLRAERRTGKDPDNGLPITINLVIYPDPNDGTFWDLCPDGVLCSPALFDGPLPFYY